MTNREKYKKAFSAVCPSDEFSLEVEKMRKKRKQHIFKTMAASVAVCLLFMTSATAVYAMDIGGIQRTIQLWIHGEYTDVTIEFDGDGSYAMEYTDADGNEQFRAGGGVALLPGGREVPLTEEELMEELMIPQVEVEYEDDGSVWVYWGDQKVDITDQFVDGVCYVKLINGEDTMYVTVKYKDGYAFGPHKYEDPDSWVSN